MRAYLKQKQTDKSGVFKMRGLESSRLEQLSDSVFALAITLILISPQVPKTADELILFTHDILSFLVSTGVIILIWYRHYLYFLRYNLRDTTTIILNALLLVVVLFYVYPLKFIITFLLRYTGYLTLALSGASYDQQAFHNLLTDTISWETLPTIMIIYNGGFIALMLAFALLHRHALQNRSFLGLLPLEQWYTKLSMVKFFIRAGVGLLAVLIDIIAEVSGFPWLAIIGGFIYFLIGPLAWVANRQLEKEKPKETDAIG